MGKIHASPLIPTGKIRVDSNVFFLFFSTTYERRGKIRNLENFHFFIRLEYLRNMRKTADPANFLLPDAAGFRKLIVYKF